MSTTWMRKHREELTTDRCRQWLEEAKNTKLRKSTGSIRTQYSIETKIWRLFQLDMKIHESRDVRQKYFPNHMDQWEEEKKNIYNNMREVLLTINQIIDDKEAEKACMAEEEQRIKFMSNAALKANRAVKRTERKMEAQQKIESGNVRRSRRIKNL